MRLTATRSVALAAALLALCLAAPAPAAARRQLLSSAAERTQAAREAAQLEAQQAELAQLVADGKAGIADQVQEQADQAEADNVVPEVQQQQLKDLAKEARRAARKAAREARKAAARSSDSEDSSSEDSSDGDSKASRRAARKAAREAAREAADSEEIATASSIDLDTDSSSTSSSSDSSSSADGGDDGATRPRGSSGPIWGKYSGRGGRGGNGFAYATYHYYAPGYETSSLYCADKFNQFLPVSPDHWLLEYPWTAYCNDNGLGPMRQEYCGRCLKATNPRTGQWVKLRVVDMCGQGGVDIDPLGFNAIDGDGAGVRDGHMNLHLEWCS